MIIGDRRKSEGWGGEEKGKFATFPNLIVRNSVGNR